jgi:hypothetical protein
MAERGPRSAAAVPHIPTWPFSPTITQHHSVARSAHARPQAFFQHLKAHGFAGVEASLTDLGACPRLADHLLRGVPHAFTPVCVMMVIFILFYLCWSRIVGATRTEREQHAQALADAGLDLVVGIYSSWQVGWVMTSRGGERAE